MQRFGSDPFHAWFAALEARHLADLTFTEVRRALQALSSLYVERRDQLPSGAALDGVGKRAAFALYYGPLHFLLIREIVVALGAASPPPRQILDLGCGTGVAAAAWALEAGGVPTVFGVDKNAWAVKEAAWTLRTLRLTGRASRADLKRKRLPGRGASILAAFTVNEIDPPARDRLLRDMLAAARRGASVLVIEPLARRGFLWWEEWSTAFREGGGRADTWRFRADLPEPLRLLDRAAGMDHRELVGRSLWISGPAVLPARSESVA